MELLQEIVVPGEGLAFISDLRIVIATMVLLFHPKAVRNVLGVVLCEVNEGFELFISIYLRSG
jgi:hypothetical protein